jgi:putative acetyltransferase
MIRSATKKDREKIIALIDQIFREYDDRVFLEGAEKDLTALPDIYHDAGGDFWVYEIDNEIIGTMAVVPRENNSAELKRFYLAANYRGSGIADKMLQHVINWCKNNHVQKLCFWSDTRFIRAHRFYSKRGFIKGGMRHMTDGLTPYNEVYYEKKLDGIS